jgi:hypothetical protein
MILIVVHNKLRLATSFWQLAAGDWQLIVIEGISSDVSFSTINY